MAPKITQKTKIYFYDMIKEEKISGRDIFFTDEKRFILNPPQPTNKSSKIKFKRFERI